MDEEFLESSGQGQGAWFNVCFEFMVSKLKNICESDELNILMQ